MLARKRKSPFITFATRDNLVCGISVAVAAEQKSLGSSESPRSPACASRATGPDPLGSAQLYAQPMDGAVVLERDRERPRGNHRPIELGRRDAALHALRVLDHDLVTRRAVSERRGGGRRRSRCCARRPPTSRRSTPPAPVPLPRDPPAVPLPPSPPAPPPPPGEADIITTALAPSAIARPAPNVRHGIGDSRRRRHHRTAGASRSVATAHRRLGRAIIAKKNATRRAGGASDYREKERDSASRRRERVALVPSGAARGSLSLSSEQEVR